MVSFDVEAGPRRLRMHPPDRAGIDGRRAPGGHAACRGRERERSRPGDGPRCVRYVCAARWPGRAAPGAGRPPGPDPTHGEPERVEKIEGGASASDLFDYLAPPPCGGEGRGVTIFRCLASYPHRLYLMYAHILIV